MAWTMVAVDIFLTAGRFIIHWRKNKRLRLDVIFNGIALFFLIGFMVTWQLYAQGMSGKAPTDFNPLHALKKRLRKHVILLAVSLLGQSQLFSSVLADHRSLYGISHCLGIRHYLHGVELFKHLHSRVLPLRQSGDLHRCWYVSRSPNAKGPQVPYSLFVAAACKRAKLQAITIMYMS